LAIEFQQPQSTLQYAYSCNKAVFSKYGTDKEITGFSGLQNAEKKQMA